MRSYPRKYRPFTGDVLPTLPTDRPIYWIQRSVDVPERGLLGFLPTGAYYKLSCSYDVFSKEDIREYWPNLEHRFITITEIPAERERPKRRR